MEPTPLQLRAAEIRETHIQKQIGNLTLALCHAMAERDALAEDNAKLMAQLAAMQKGDTDAG